MSILEQATEIATAAYRRAIAAQTDAALAENARGLAPQPDWGEDVWR